MATCRQKKEIEKGGMMRKYIWKSYRVTASLNKHRYARKGSKKVIEIIKAPSAHSAHALFDYKHRHKAKIPMWSMNVKIKKVI
jgi:hypothetical protein